MGAAQSIDIHGAKGGSDKPKTPTEAPDSLRSVAIAKMLIAVGEGEFAGLPTAQNIYLDNTPLQDPQGNLNFPNVKWEFRSGSVEQGYIQGIPSVENETSLGIELRSGTPWVRAISNTDLSAVRLRFAWPALQSVDTSNNIKGYRIEYKVELATDGGTYQQVLSEAVDGKTTSTYERTRRIDLPKATSGWLIRVTRVTVNQNNNKIADTMQIAGFTEVIDAKLRYPNTALLYVEFSAEQFRNIPAVTIKCKGRKFQVPNNYDPETRSYTGIWDGTFKLAWTDNPAWVTYGITTNDRFGLGRRIKPWQVDKWELYRIAQYCDQLVPDGKGGQEPRFICNLNLQGKADAWSLLRDISAIYRGMTYWAQGQVFSLADMPRATDFDFAYTRANVIDGKFSYSSASERTRYSRVLISYDDPANNYDTDVTSVTDPKLQRRYGDNPLELSAIGCTRESEAQRRGKWALLTNSRDRGISFKVGLDGRIPLPGYVIPVADELLAGRAVGGRISAVAGRVITLDRDTQAKAGDRLILNLPSGKCEGRTVQSVSGRAVTVTTTYSVAPEPQLVWALDADDLAIPLYRVTSVSRPEPGVFEITAIQYDPSKFAHIDTGARLEERPISVIPISVVPAPASVSLTSNTIIAQGLAVTTMTIAWPSVPGAVAYDVEWRKDNGNWIKVQRTGALGVDVIGIYSGAYLARVRAVSSFEISSIWKSSNLTQLNGKTGTPPAVTSLTATSLLFGIGLNWAFPAGSEDTQRTEIWYGPTPVVGSATKLADLAYPQANYSMQSLQAGAQFFFWARLIDRTGNVGPFYPVGNGVMGQASADAGPILDQIAGQITETELGGALLDRIELIDGPPTLAGSVAQKVAAEAAARAAADLANANAISKEVTDRAAAVLAEAQARAAEDLVNAGKITKEVTDRAAAILAEAQARGTAITSEANTRSSADSALSTRIDTVTASTGGNASAIQTEITARTNADSALGTRIDTVAAGTASNLVAIGTEITARTNADSALGTRIDTVVATATTDRTSASAAVTGEATARVNGDSALGSRIDTVSATLAGKADASAVNALTTRVTSAEGAITSQGSNLTQLSNTLIRVGSNSPTKVYQSVFTDLGLDDWVKTSGGGSASLSNVEGNNSGATLTMDGGAASNWWGRSNKLTRFDPSRLYRITVRAQQISIPSGKAPKAYFGFDCFAENGVTRININGANDSSNSHYTVMGGGTLSLGVWTEYVAYLKGYAAVGASGNGGAGTIASPKNLRAGVAYFSPMTITGYNTEGGVAAIDYFIVEDVTDQVQIDATSAALSSLDSTVTQQGTTLTSQGSSITSLNNSLTTTNNNVTAAQTAATNAATQAGSKGKVLVQTAAPAAADQLAQNLWIDTTGGANTPKRWNGSAWTAVSDKVATDAAAAAASALSQVATKADASALNSLTTRVTSAEGEISSQGTSLTGLTNSLTTTNTNVTAAQNAANAANTLAGGKGKVIVQTAAPAVADQLAQNLWIDITGGANTPKRWNGTAWVAVTDKVATDAAAAAANALSVANTKADASAVNSLTTRVTTAEGTITSQGTAITGLNNSLATTNTNVTAAQAAATAANNLAGGKGKVLVQTATPAAADQLVQNLWIDITSSANTPKRWTGSAWAAVTDKVATDAAAAAANALSVANTKADSAAVTALTSRVTTAEGTITSQGSNITSLTNSLSVTNGNVTTAQNAATAAQTAAQAASDLAGGKGKVLVQSTTPATTDQLIQNLWIDTTGSANTPKRWTGSVWAAVTDKVASDAAVAAANALTVANTKADAGAVSALTTRVTNTEGAITSQGNSLTELSNTLTRVGSNSPTKVYQSVFTDLGLDTWVKTSGGGSASLSNVAGNNSGATLTMDGGAASNWWGRSNKLTRFDPSRLYKITVRAQQVSIPAGKVPKAFFGLDCFAENGVTRINVNGANDAGSSHYIVMSGGTLTLGVWTEYVTYFKGHAAVGATGGVGAGTIASPKNLRAGVAYFSPMTITGYNIEGGVAAIDYFIVEDVTDQVQIDATSAALSALDSTVTEQGTTLTSQGSSITSLNNSLTTTNNNVTAAQTAATNAATLAGSKGKVLVQTAAPAAADQLAQNLWIDITGGANTPKRWTGSAWAAVSDKVATDAAAAALAATNAVASKADASAVNALTTRVTAAEGTITSQGNAATTLTNRVTTAETSLTAQSTAISNTNSAVTALDGEVTAITTKVDGIYAQVNPALAGDTLGYAGSTSSFVGVWSELSARIEDGQVIGTRVDMVEVISNESAATAQQASAAIQQVSQAVVDLDDKASAMWSVKLQVNSQGQYVAAGIGLGIENGPAGLQSQFLVSADLFAVVNGINGALSSPFAVLGGQVFMNSAFIQDGSITNLKIGQVIQSDNYVPGQTGWILHKSGTMEFNGTIPGGGRLTITNRAVKVFDNANTLRVQLGDLTA